MRSREFHQSGVGLGPAQEACPHQAIGHLAAYRDIRVRDAQTARRGDGRHAARIGLPIGKPLVQRLLKIEPHEQPTSSQLADLARSNVEVPRAHRGAGQPDHRQVPAKHLPDRDFEVGARHRHRRSFGGTAAARHRWIIPGVSCPVAAGRKNNNQNQNGARIGALRRAMAENTR